MSQSIIVSVNITNCTYFWLLSTALFKKKKKKSSFSVDFNKIPKDFSFPYTISGWSEKTVITEMLQLKASSSKLIHSCLICLFLMFFNRSDQSRKDVLAFGSYLAWQMRALENLLYIFKKNLMALPETGCETPND